MILKFSWHLVDVLTHEEVFLMIYDLLRDVFDAFNSLGMPFEGLLCSLSTKDISIIFRCIFEFSFAFLASWELLVDI